MAQAISDAMTPDPVSVDPHASAADAARCIPVIDADEHPIGIVSIGDLALARQERSALADISGAPANQ